MIYNNDPRLDLPQQQLMGKLAERFAHPGTVFIPNRVRYVVTGYDPRTPDPTGHTSSADWGTSIDRIQGQTGPTLTAARRLVNPRWRKARPGLEVPPLPPGQLTARHGYPDRSGMTQLTGTEPFTEIGYSRPETASAYPTSLALPVTRSGRIDIVIWRQDLLFDDLLIRSSETAQPVEPAHTVKPGDTVTLALDDRWNDKVPITVPAPAEAERRILSARVDLRHRTETCRQASAPAAHSWQRPRLHACLTDHASQRRNGSGILITHADSRARQNLLFCAFTTDCQPTVEAPHNGGSVRAVTPMADHAARSRR